MQGSHDHHWNIQEAAVLSYGTTTCSIFQSENACSDSVTFKLWFYEVFLPHIRKRTSKLVAVVTENCGPHGTDIIDSREQVIIMTLPPNCTRRHQPMDLGIIAACEVHYRQNMLRLIVADLEDRMQHREKSANKPCRHKGYGRGV